MELLRAYRTRGEDYQIKVVIESKGAGQGLEICDAVQRALARINRRLEKDGGSRLGYRVELFKTTD